MALAFGAVPLRADNADSRAPEIRGPGRYLSRGVRIVVLIAVADIGWNSVEADFRKRATSVRVLEPWASFRRKTTTPSWRALTPSEDLLPVPPTLPRSEVPGEFVDPSVISEIAGVASPRRPRRWPCGRACPRRAGQTLRRRWGTSRPTVPGKPGAAMHGAAGSPAWSGGLVQIFHVPTVTTDLAGATFAAVSGVRVGNRSRRVRTWVA